MTTTNPSPDLSVFDLNTSIPFDLLPMVTANLAEMPWVPSSYTDGRDGYVERFHGVAQGLLAT